jgi:hypothetical protein
MRDFTEVPRTPRGQLGIFYYAAAYRVIYYLRSRAVAEGRTLDDIFREHPFLSAYFGQVRAMLPEGIEWAASIDWLRREVEAWESESRKQGSLPLTAMRDALNLPHEAVLAFVLVGTVEEDAQFTRMFEAVEQGEATHRLSLALLQQIFEDDEHPEPWLMVRPLLDGGFLDVANREAPRSRWTFRVPSVLWNAVRGDGAAGLFSGARHRAHEELTPLSDLIINEDLRDQLTELGALIAGGRTRAVVVRGMPGTDRARVIGAVAHQLGRGIVEIECSATTPATDERWRFLGPFCTLTHSLPLFSIEAGPGETFELPTLAGYQGPLAVMIGRDGGIGDAVAAHAITLQLDLETPAQRTLIWRRELNGHAGASRDVEEIASTFCLPGRYIRQCARLSQEYATLNRRTSVTVPDVRRAARAINRQVLDTLAARIDGAAWWNQLIVRDATSRELRVLEGRCRHREILASRLESSIPGGMNRGVRALLEGPSGTGKTLAARVLATELGLDLYRVDLASVVNKYIGETEKNLSRVLSRAEDLNVILLLDEGDSLMSQRTDVKSANDRYANLETNYLLQRLESYTGIVVITTNAGQSIDSAFRRRMDSVVTFHTPDAEERWRLWQVHLPPDHMVDGNSIDEIAGRYQLTGGQIRNACVNAVLIALGRGNGLHSSDIREAIRAEHRKSGATFIETTQPLLARNDLHLTNFAGGLS